MKCSECNGRGHFLMLMSTPQCDVCAGTGEAPAAAITSPGAPREFRDLSIGYAPESTQPAFDSRAFMIREWSTKRAATRPYPVRWYGAAGETSKARQKSTARR
jgi:hypothetical protein